MKRKKRKEFFAECGFRFCMDQQADMELYYRYWQEGFHVVLVPGRQGRALTPEQHRAVVEQVMGRFYHPQGFLADFPEGFPVYHVEVLTLLVTDQPELARQLCAQCQNMWICQPGQGRLVIYENQPGEFFGLRRKLEQELAASSDADSSMRLVEIGQLPVVTISLVLANVLVYLILELAGNPRDGMYIALCGGMYPSLLLEDHQWWRLFTAGFLHFGATHLVNNMVTLFFIGERVERVAGHIRMLLIYLLSLLGGSLLSFVMMLRTGDYAVSAGASGAVFGVIGGLLWIVLLHRGQLEDITIRRLLFMIALSVYLGFVSVGVDVWGHIGGILTGFVAAVILYHRKRQRC